MNSFGRVFRVSIFGESHGPSVGISIDGCPAGLPLNEDDFTTDIERRKGGMQKGTTPRKEDDKPIFMTGVFNGKTTGAPLTIIFENKNTRSGDYEKQRAVPRPGHADLVAHQKFGGFEDFRGGGHFSGRLTVCLVGAGVVAKKILQHVKRDLTPGPSPKERGVGDPGYLTNSPEQWQLVTDFAKENRKHPIEAESILWEELRNRKLGGCKFRRQHPVEGYIPDFVCLEKKLVVEIDGEYHDAAEQQRLDEQRTDILNRNGFRLIRFRNEEVLNNLSGVLQKIKTALSDTTDTENDLPTNSNHNENYQSRAASPSPSERGPGGEVVITSTILEIAGLTNLEAGLQKAIDQKDSVGGIVECRVTGLPPGLGEPFFDSAESLLAHAVFAIPAVRGIEFGTGFAAARMFGVEHNDSIIDAEGTTATNHAGGVVGGITNGNELVFRIAIKPTSSTPKEQQTWNWESGQMDSFSVKGRHDLCIALRVPPVLEAVTAMVLADLLLLEQRVNRVL